MTTPTPQQTTPNPTSEENSEGNDSVDSVVEEFFDRPGPNINNLFKAPTTSELDRLRAQNAKLLAALKLSEVYIDLQTSDPRNAKLARQDLATVRAALSEAKGED